MDDAFSIDDSTPLISSKLSALTRQHHIPLIALFELTHRCNLRCKHCYIDHTSISSRPDELTTKEIKHALNQLAEAGALHLVFTGGEIFLRPDIFELCQYAREKSFDLRLFTNASLLSCEDIKRVSDLKISRIESSVYGRPETHDMITGMPGSWEKTTDTLRQLLSAGVPVSIKTPLMTLNYDDFEWLSETALQWGIIVHPDPIIVPKNTGSTDILKYRINTRQLHDVYTRNTHMNTLSSVHRPDSSCTNNQQELKSDNITVRSEVSDFICSAGLNMVSIGPSGTVYPCLQLLLPLGNIKYERFQTIWSDANPVLNRYRSLTLEDIDECRVCHHSDYCQRCPGLALLEDGSMSGPSRISCVTADIHHQLRS
ncbi:MAG: radical SAM protein [Endomicrobiales bacterium]